MNAWTTVGSVWPEFSVPGMMRSGTRRKKRNKAVVVANEPIPRVSKKFVIAPMPISVKDGNRTSAAGEGAPGGFRRTATTAALQPATNSAVSAPSAPCSARIGLIPIPARSPFRWSVAECGDDNSEFRLLLLKLGVGGEHVALERLVE